MSTQRPVSPATLAALVQGVGGGLGWSSLAAALPAIRAEGGFSLLACASVWAAGVAGTVAGALPGAAAVSCFGARRTGAFALVLGGLACALRVFAEGPFALAAIMAVFGVHIGFMGPAVSGALAASVPAQALGAASRRALLAYGLGTLACFALIPLLGAAWREVMPAFGLLLGGLSLVWHRLIPEGSRGVPLTRAELGALSRNRGLRRVVLVQLLLFGAYLSLLVVLPALLASPALVAGWLAVAVTANVFGARWSERLGLRRPFLLGGATLAGLSLLGLAAGGPPALILLTGLGGGVMAPLITTLPLELPYAGAPPLSAALGVVLFGGQLGGVVLPLASAAALQHSGPTAAWVLLAAAHLLILVPAGRLAETGSRATLAAAQVDFDGAAA